MKWWIAVALSALAILVATLHPSGSTVASEWTFYLTSGEHALAELIQNLLLFIPLGISLSLAGVPLIPSVLIGAGLSFSVEFLQQWIPGRDPSVGDIVSNSLSTALGAGLARLVPRWLFASPNRSAWQALATALVAMLGWLATAALLRPAFPPPPHNIVERPDWEHWGRYRGTILSARLVRGMLIVDAIAAPRPPRRETPLAAVLDAQGTKGVVLAVQRHDLLLRYHMPAVMLRLEQPDLRWRDALANIAPRDTFLAGTSHDPENICLGLNKAWRCGLGYTIGDGWQLIFSPEGWPNWIMALINACWVAGCVVGVGFWAARTADGENNGGEKGGGEGRRRAAKVAVAISLVGLIVVPMVTGLHATRLTEWIGALLGLELGLVLGSRSRHDPVHRPG